MATQRQRIIYAAISGVMSIILSVTFAVWYTTYQNSKWCETLKILTVQDPRTAPQASTPLGASNRERDIKQYDALKRRYNEFHCH